MALGSPPPWEGEDKAGDNPSLFLLFSLLDRDKEVVKVKKPLSGCQVYRIRAMRETEEGDMKLNASMNAPISSFSTVSQTDHCKSFLTPSCFFYTSLLSDVVVT